MTSFVLAALCIVAVTALSGEEKPITFDDTPTVFKHFSVAVSKDAHPTLVEDTIILEPYRLVQLHAEGELSDAAKETCQWNVHGQTLFGSVVGILTKETHAKQEAFVTCGESRTVFHVRTQYVRRNLKTMPKKELAAFHAAMTAFKQGYIEDGTYQFPTYDHIVAAHAALVSVGCTPGPRFLPLHGMILATLERHLQYYDPSVSVPYWDFEEEYNHGGNTEYSFMWTEEYFGTTDSKHHVNTSPYATWEVSKLGLELGSPVVNSYGLLRSINSNTAEAGLYRYPNHKSITHNDIPTPEALESCVATGPYSKVWDCVVNFHVWAHTQGGGVWFRDDGSRVIGDLVDSYTSPNDPVFFVIHSNVDRLWRKYQAAAGNACGEWDYDDSFCEGHNYDAVYWPVVYFNDPTLSTPSTNRQMCEFYGDFDNMPWTFDDQIAKEDFSLDVGTVGAHTDKAATEVQPSFSTSTRFFTFA